MNWTTDKPIKKGYYWVWHPSVPGWNDAHFHLIKFMGDDDDIEILGTEVAYPISDFSHFIGPLDLEEPEPPEG